MGISTPPFIDFFLILKINFFHIIYSDCSFTSSSSSQFLSTLPFIQFTLSQKTNQHMFGCPTTDCISSCLMLASLISITVVGFLESPYLNWSSTFAFYPDFWNFCLRVLACIGFAVFLEPLSSFSQFLLVLFFFFPQ